MADLKRLTEDAGESMYILTSYSTATGPVMDLLKTAGKRLDVSFINNSNYSANNVAAYPNYRYHRQKYLDTGIDIYEFIELASLHGKGMVFDDKISAIGSFNMDSHSTYLCTETMMIIDSEEFTEDFVRILEEIKANSLKVGEDNEYIHSENIKDKDISFKKRLIFFLSFVALRLFQFFI